MSDSTYAFDRLIDEMLTEADNGQNMTRASQLAERMTDMFDALRADLAAANARVAELEARIEKAHPVADYWLDGNVIRKGKEYVAEIIGQEPLLLRELLIGKPAVPPAEAKVRRAAAVEQAASLAEKVSGVDTANTIRHSGVYMRPDEAVDHTVYRSEGLANSTGIPAELCRQIGNAFWRRAMPGVPPPDDNTMAWAVGTSLMLLGDRLQAQPTNGLKEVPVLQSNNSASPFPPAEAKVADDVVRDAVRTAIVERGPICMTNGEADKMTAVIMEAIRGQSA